MSGAVAGNVRTIQCLLQCLLNGINSFFTDFLGGDRLGDDGQEVINVHFLLIRQGLGVVRQYPVGQLEGLFGHMFFRVHLGG